VADVIREGGWLWLGGEAGAGAGAGAGPPLIAVASWHDEPSRFEALARELGDRPICLIGAPEGGDDLLPHRVDEWVELKLSVFRRLPVGPPYCLIGWSFGGILALELARRLEAEGAEVSYVGMIDTWRARGKPRTVRAAFWTVAGGAAQINDPAARSAYVRRGARAFLKQRRRRARTSLWRWARRAGLLRHHVPPGSMESVEPLKRAIWRSNLSYAGDAVTFPVALFTTDHSVEQTQDETLGWAPWLRGGFQLFRLPGDHKTLFDPAHLAETTDAIRRSLDASALLSSSYSRCTSSSPQ
jgi:thioesterase domain-containing protein